MFPYPSGAGLHVGHPEGYTATDILARYKRMRGFNVLHPMGWDAFGLPAEQYAVQTGTHPAETTKKNVNRFRQQLQSLGFSYDWKREVSTTEVQYYKWTQWIFLQLYKKGLAYQDYVPVNWCPALGTVLANEEVIDGKSERGGFPVERKPMRQWVLKITAYADRLLEDLDGLDWPESIKEMQRNWIGKSVGAELDFQVDSNVSDAKTITVFTTRPETVCGVSYLCVAPEYDDLDHLVTKEHSVVVKDYVTEAKNKSDRERTGDAASGVAPPKTGVFTGSYAINPLTKEKVPIWVADYVLGGYGTGAVMAVPAHDQRDYEFAQVFDLPVKPVITGGNLSQSAHTGPGTMMNWGKSGGIELDGLDSDEARSKLLNHLETTKQGVRKVNYKLRDWLFSRQRYWGEPFPIYFVDGKPVAVDEADLPVTLPEMESFAPAGDGQSPLAKATEWLKVTDRKTGKEGIRETNTMPQWAGSCWYYLRFIDPFNPGKPVDPELEKYWMPVDLYVGGVEHAVLHLLYARFWHKVLFDCGVVTTKEPFQRLVNQGMILGEMEYSAYRLTSTQEWVPTNDVNVNEMIQKSTGMAVEVAKVEPDQVTKSGDNFVLSGDDRVKVSARAHKMSKSRGNVVNPDSVIDLYGADALRCYLMFMGPLDQVKPWSTQAVQGMARFLSRVWRLIVDSESSNGVNITQVKGLNPLVTDDEPTGEQLRALHAAIAKVSDDTENLRFNTALSALMEFVNTMYKWPNRPKSIMNPFVLLLSPYAPHLSEELWSQLGHKTTLAYEPWPEADPKYLVAEEKTIMIQVNGKIRSKLVVPTDTNEQEVVKQAMEQDGVKKYTDGKTIRKQIYVPDKLLNIVVG